MKKTISLSALACLSAQCTLHATTHLTEKESSVITKPSDAMPEFLYKILPVDKWEASKAQKSLVLTSDDDTFVHFSKEDQYQKVADKFWKDKSYVLLKITAAKLKGALILEANRPGGDKYWHLYDGSIPLEAVVEFTLIEAQRGEK